MKHPFKLHDVVHHPRHGECKIVNFDHEDARDVLIHNSTSVGGVWVGHAELSFSPWPHPNWERPKPPFVPVLKEEDWVQARHWQDKSRTFSFRVCKETEKSVVAHHGGVYDKQIYTFHLMSVKPVEFNK